MTKRIKVDWNNELLDACQTNNIEKVRKALENGADVECRDENGCYSLVWATIKGYSDIVRMLIECGVDVNVRVGGWTALMWAAYKSHTAVVRLFIKANADINAVSDGGVTTLDLACRKKEAWCVEMLLDAGANWRVTSDQSWTKKVRPFLQKILDSRAKRRVCGMTTALCLRGPLGRDVANLIGKMIWIDRERIADLSDCYKK